MDKVAMYKEHIMEKVAGIKQMQRILEAESKAANPKIINHLGLFGMKQEEAGELAHQIKKHYKGIQASGKDMHYKGNAAMEGIRKGNGIEMKHHNLKINQLDELDKKLSLPNTESHLQSLHNAEKINKANVHNAVAEANRISDLRDTHLHGKKLNYESKLTSSQSKHRPQFIQDSYDKSAHRVKSSNPVENRGKEEFYYSGKDDDKIVTGNKAAIPKHDALWVSAHPEVADTFGNHVFQFKNTKEFTRFGEPRTHNHIAKDSRLTPSQLISLREKHFNFTNRDPHDYERVVNYDPKAFKDSFVDVYSKSKNHNYKVGDNGQVIRVPKFISATGEDRKKALSKFKNFDENINKTIHPVAKKGIDGAATAAVLGANGVATYRMGKNIYKSGKQISEAIAKRRRQKQHAATLAGLAAGGYALANSK